jgi:hypothetical protein
MNFHKYLEMIFTHMINSKDLAILMLVLFIFAILALFGLLFRETNLRLKDRVKFEEKLDAEQEKRLNYWQNYAVKATQIMEAFVKIKKENNQILKDLAKVVLSKGPCRAKKEDIEVEP